MGIRAKITNFSFSINGFTTMPSFRDQASPETREARGPPSLAAWNGMGPCGYHRPPFTIPVPGLYVIVVIFAVLMSVQAFPQSGSHTKCQVQQCGIAFYQARQNVDIEDNVQLNDDAECKALRTYRHCITKAEAGCYGDLTYHSHRKMASKLMQTNNCTMSGERLETTVENQPRQPIVPAICRYPKAKIYRHCSLFGDPHLRTFYEEFQTCRVKGAWPLINNEYLAVQVTNDPVKGNTVATATSKLTVIVKGNSECTTKDFQTYQAQSNFLPSTFEDGRVTYGPYQGLELVEVDPGKHVEIHIRYIETVIIIRQIGRYFTFSIKMPEELLNKTNSNENIQLCVRGCPAAEQIKYKEYLANRNRSVFQSVKAVRLPDGPGTTTLTWEYAEQVCREAKLVDFYFDSCVFDLMATGDLNFTLSALGALRDMVKLNPLSTRTWMNRSWLSDSSATGNGCLSSLLRTHSWHRLQIVLLLFLTCLTKVLLWNK